MLKTAARLLLLLTVASPTWAQPAPLCEVSTDPQYGFSKERPIQVGGSPVYGAARQRRYLDALRGPEGQPVQYTRVGSAMGTGDMLLDQYEVTYAGLEKPVLLFLDWYHFTDTPAPRGFICGQAIGLGTPPPDPFMAREQIAALALEQGAVRRFDPIPMTPGAPSSGWLFDPFRLLALAARGAAAVKAPMDPDRLPPELLRPRTAGLALPQPCGDRPVLPDAVVLVNAKGGVAPIAATVSQAGDLARLLPGLEVPAGSTAAVWTMEGFGPGMSVKITYREPCAGGAAEVTLPIETTPARLLESPMPRRPAGDMSSTSWVVVQALIDHDGAFRRAVALGGPPALTKAALDAVATWKVEPPRVNGAPIVAPVVLRVGFVPPEP